MLIQKRTQRKAGSALVVCLVTGMILGIVMVGYLTMVSSNQRAVARSEAWNTTMPVIEAGIDVSQISSDDILFDEVNNILSLSLPYPTLQSCYLDEQQSYIVQRNTAAFGVPLNNLEDNIRQQALLDYRNRAIEEGILTTAQTEAERVMRDFLGIILNPETTLIVQFEAPLLDAPLPVTCQG